MEEQVAMADKRGHGLLHSDYVYSSYRPDERRHIGSPYMGIYPKEVSPVEQSDKYSHFRHTEFSARRRLFGKGLQ
nr:unnamed protein product [Spirometra erinaceieuropaei]